VESGEGIERKPRITGSLPVITVSWWNPVKELKADPSPLSQNSPAFAVESGEGIER